VLDHVVLTDNWASYGGGICCQESNPKLANVTMYGNGAYFGAGMACWHSSATVENTIIAMSTQGRAVYCYGDPSVGTFACCDLFGNAGGDWIGCIAGQSGVDGNISEDPLLCDPDDGDFHLQPDSPCAPFTPANPECDLIGAWPVGCETAEAASDAPRATWTFEVSQAAPNPFEGVTTLTYSVPSSAALLPVRLDVYDVLGRRVRTLVDAYQPSGAHSAEWNGKDSEGAPAAPGVYFCVLSVGEERNVRRVVLVR
jgi:hypothetical protein